ncbi:MAG: efflux RND transporter permease subunit [Bacteroidales bacterium]|nr:efflux RND transporter permease subunit [Bacteroidales bacterium]
MRNLVAVFVKYPFYANLIIFVFFLAGIFGVFQMKKSFFPERTPKMITVQVAYPGASPKEMEEGVTMRVEEAIRGIVGIKEVTSTSSENFSVVRIETTGQYDLDESLMDVKNAVDGISSFPVDAEKPVVFKERNKTQAMFMGLVGENGTDLLELKKLADGIEFDLLTSGPVSQVNISGYPPLEISVEITEEDLLRYNLTISELTNVIRVNNQDISGGQIKSDTEEILIRTRNRSVNPQDIGDIVLRTNTDGSMLRLRDVATVDLQFFDNSQSSFMNGNRLSPSISRSCRRKT